MRKLFFSIFVLALLSGNQVRGQDIAAVIFDKNRLSVLRVEISPDSKDPDQTPISGTGFLISPDGFVVTAKHIIAGYINSQKTPIVVSLLSLPGVKIPAEPSNFELGQDVALLKLPSPSTFNIGAYPVIMHGDARSLNVGDALYLISYRLNGPIGVSPVTLVSNQGGGLGGIFLWEVSSGATSGSSGGPIFNKNGNVVGILKGGIPGTPVNYMYPEYIIEPFAQIANWQRVGEPFSVDAKINPSNTTDANHKRIQINLRVPNSPFTATTTKISIYFFRIVNGRRMDESPLPDLSGIWHPGDSISFPVELPNIYFSDRTWQMYVCVGNQSGCVPSNDVMQTIR